MNALAQATRPQSRNQHLLNRKNVVRRQNALDYRSRVADLLELLSQADLSATTYRLALDVLARGIRHGRITEAVPTTWLAERLGVHRNSITQAFTELDGIDFLRRIAVKHRGAPTRTKLVGLAGWLVDRTSPASVKLESGPSGPIGPDSPFSDDSAPPEGEGDTAQAAALSPPERPATAPPAEAKPAGTPFVFNPATNAAMMAKVPAAARALAMQTLDGSVQSADPAWCLTEGEAAHYLALFPKKEPMARRPAIAPAAKELPSADLACALIQSLPQLQALAGSAAQAHVLADQIAYQVMCCDLGRGNVLAGVRAGVKLVERKVWTEPRDWSSQCGRWGGIALRARTGQTRRGQGDAQQTMH